MTLRPPVYVSAVVGSVVTGVPSSLATVPRKLGCVLGTLPTALSSAPTVVGRLPAELRRIPGAVRSFQTHPGPGRTQRRLWSRPGRAHIEVRAVHKPGSDVLVDALERELRALDGVEWAQVNAVVGRVVVAFADGGPSVEDLVAVIEGVEEAHGVAGDRFPYARPEHPGDIEPLRRNAIAIAGDVAGLGLSAFGLLLRATPIPLEVASVVSLAEQQPRIREILERRVGVEATDLGLGLCSALSQALGQGPFGLVIDVLNRANVTGELQARRRAWERREMELTRAPDDLASEALDRQPRPAPLPLGPVERFADRAALASATATAVSFAVTRRPRRAAAMLSAGVPKAARLGREAFAAHLGRELARRDVVVLDGNALRRLDRVDTVLVDEQALLTYGVDSQIDPLSEALANIVRRNHLLLVTAGRQQIAEELGAERCVPGGHELLESVRDLQRDGRVVLLVSDGGQPGAMAAADCAIGVRGRTTSTPWSADILTRSGLGDAHFLVSAVPAAREASARSVLISLAGSVAAGAWSTIGPAAGAGRRAALPVNTAALVAQVNGVLGAERLARRPAPASAEPPPWHAIDAESVLTALSTSVEGLSASEVARRRGQRRRKLPAVARLGRAVATELANPLTPVLAVGTGLAGALGSVTDAALVGSVAGANAVIGGVQRMRAEASIARLLEISASTVTVRRAGETREIERDELVPGDVVELSPGDVVPADCRIVTCDSLEVDESVLTGESLPVGKDPAAIRGATVSDRASVLYDGTTVVNGTALAVVTATGDDSEVGRSLADAPAPPPSGVEARLRSITAVTLPVTLLSGAGVTGMSLLRGRSPRVAVRSGMSLMIAAVPEGLPIVATVAQLAAARRMSEHGAIVRNARTMEALGRVDMLCFDKTGTLTEGKIALQRVSDGSRDAIVGRLTSGQRAVLGAALRSSPDEAADGSLVHATDRAVVGGAASADVGADEGLGEWQLIDELAFEPARGYHAVVGKTPEGLRISVKGAPEVVLPRCVRWRGPEGIVEMSDRVRALLVSEVERLASLGLRVLAVAENSVPEGRRATREELGDEDVEALELLGFCGLADQVRPTASQAVGVLRSAGVDTVMITGDHPATAQAIAHELGMNDRKRVITGPEIDALDDEELQRELKDVSLFARVTPSHKVRIVRAYQKAGHVVAMTGDGANDAPAIRRAHTGIAVGKRGSPAAREAADLVIVDDRIETIVDAIVEGRAMWVSVREALAILVGGNLGEIGFTVAGTAISGASPLGPRQLLLVNLLTDMLPALAIALRQPPEHGASSLLHEGPDASLGEALARQIAMRAAVTAGGSLGAWAVARSTGTRRRASTVGLAALVGTQLGQTAVVGGKNPIVLGSTLLSAGVLIGVVQTPGVSQFFGCTPLGPFGWGIATFATVAGTSASVLLPWASRTMAGLRPETGEIRASDPTSLSKGGESPPDP